MAMTLQDIENMIAAEADQSSTIDADSSSSDWSLRRSYVNRAQRDFSDAYDWRDLITEVNSRSSQATGNATIALPSDFRKPAGYLTITYDGSTAQEYSEVDMTKRSQYPATDFYFSVVGNESTGKSYVVSPGSMVSGASIYYTYYHTLPSLVSPADITHCPDPTYLVEKSLFYLYKSRSDERFQDAGVRADSILARLIEMEEARSEAHGNQVQVNPRSSFRWGK